MRLLFTVFLGALVFAGPAHAVNRCVVDGKVVYSERPCPAGTTSRSTVDSTNARSSREAQLEAEVRALKQKNELQGRELEAERSRRQVSEPTQTSSPQPRSRALGFHTAMDIRPGMTRAQVEAKAGRAASKDFGWCSDVSFAETWTYPGDGTEPTTVVFFCSGHVVNVKR